MHYLFQKALKTGKKVRSEHLLHRGLPEIEHAIFNTGCHLFKDTSSAKILFVGVSDINQKILHFLRSKNLEDITICNRTDESAVALARNYQLKTLEWNDIFKWQLYDWMIFGTKSPEHLITSKQLPSDNISPKLIIDLSVPRNVEPQVARHPKITLLNIDQINRMLLFRKQKMFHMLAEAEQYVVESTKQQTFLFQQKQQHRERLLVNDDLTSCTMGA